jgi:hypothetical protein
MPCPSASLAGVLAVDHFATMEVVLFPCCHAVRRTEITPWAESVEKPEKSNLRSNHFIDPHCCNHSRTPANKAKLYVFASLLLKSCWALPEALLLPRWRQVLWAHCIWGGQFKINNVNSSIHIMLESQYLRWRM